MKRTIETESHSYILSDVSLSGRQYITITEYEDTKKFSSNKMFIPLEMAEQLGVELFNAAWQMNKHIREKAKQ